MSYYIFSTLAADVSYDTYNKGADSLPIKLSSIIVKGGTGIADSRLMTPNGAIATKIDDEDLELLTRNPVFKAHVENGFITVLKGEADNGVVAKDMLARDISAPLVESDFAADEVPTTRRKRK